MTELVTPKERESKNPEHQARVELEEERLREEVMRSRRSGQPLVVVILDANRLKAINDNQGHQAGDEYLQRIARVLQTASRASDVTARETEEEGKSQQAARWGGDEFGIILFDTDEKGANVWWERAKTRFEEEQISVAAGMEEIPVQELQKPDFNAGDLIKTVQSHADEAMYAAKNLSRETGRNEILSYKAIPVKAEPPAK